jgi:hypothetical protein
LLFLQSTRHLFAATPSSPASNDRAPSRLGRVRRT